MLILRLALVLLVVVLVYGGAMYVLTRDQRYLRFAFQSARVAVLAACIFVLLFILERYVLVGWRVLL